MMKTDGGEGQKKAPCSCVAWPGSFLEQEERNLASAILFSMWKYKSSAAVSEGWMDPQELIPVPRTSMGLLELYKNHSPNVGVHCRRNSEMQLFPNVKNMPEIGAPGGLILLNVKTLVFQITTLCNILRRITDFSLLSHLTNLKETSPKLIIIMPQC